MQANDEDSLVVSGINVTPLVDITLVLLIIFMVTATFVSEQGLKVHLPKVITRETAPSPALSISMDKEGRLRLMKKDMTLAELLDQMAREVKLDPAVKVLVKADQDLPYFKVVEVLDTLKLTNIHQTTLAMDRK